MADPLRQAREARNAARTALDARVAQVKQDVSARSIGQRIAAKAKNDARAAATEAVEVARESKTIIAGAAALIAGWYLRAPILGWLAAHLSGTHETTEETTHD